MSFDGLGSYNYGSDLVILGRGDPGTSSDSLILFRIVDLIFYLIEKGKGKVVTEERIQFWSETTGNPLSVR